ncbi:uncharacterized protein N7459_002048 [Penicillium hispanicum]|uniref:uncharacterized protein n=1 Tax=Penicillium hispanicum TaxID=1080232 RepID=UPI0025425BB4|nr:uncharacterized protein N7459_002048 [Penicillium hispanicum]KAJ5591679.1 hypothetical protein N7459_002048 [Penicillium hispanicum]
MPAAAERDQRGASGLEESAEGAVLTAAGLAWGEDLLHQRPRSRSISPPAAEKALDLAPKSHSRPSSPETTRHDENTQPRRTSLARSTTESPTAVPLHFRRPPLSPGLQRSTPSESPRAESPGSPSQPRHRRLNSIEFRNSREIRPLWLVERHSSAKAEPEPEEPLPSLPSSKTSSRAPSVEDLRTLHDEDAVKSWEPIDLSPSMMDRRRPGLTISTERANNADGEADLLDSQQATPTAEDYGLVTGSAKKEKLKYEFHSPSELLQDPETYQELPPSPTIEPLPSAEGSMVGTKDPVETDVSHEHERALDVQQEAPQPDVDTPTQEQPPGQPSFIESHDGTTGPGFSGIVDAAVIAAAKEDHESIEPVDKEDSQPAALPKEGDTVPAERDLSLPETAAEPSSAPGATFPGLADVVTAAVAAKVSHHDKAPTEGELGEPGTAIEEESPKPFEQTESVPPVEFEATKELALESAEPPSETAQPQPTEEPVAEVATPSSKKKNKKKNKKKGQASQSVDLPPVEPEAEPSTATDEANPAANLQSESRGIEPEPTSVAVEQETTGQPHPEAESYGAQRELGTESLPAATAQPTEPLTAPEPVEAQAADEPQPESANTPDAIAEHEVEPELTSAPEPVEAQAADEPQPESAPTADAIVEPEQPENDAALSKKEKREKKKKQRKKSKSISSADQAEGPAHDVIPQPTDTTLIAGEVEPQVDTAPAIGHEISEASPAAEVPAIQESSDLQASQEIEGPTEPVPAGEPENEEHVVDVSKSTEERTSSEAPESESREIEISESAPDAKEEPQPAQDGTESTEEPVIPETASQYPRVPEVTNETEKDDFHEAVEQQAAATEENKNIPAEQAVDVVTEGGPSTEPQDTVPESMEDQPIKKGKKGKRIANRCLWRRQKLPSTLRLLLSPRWLPGPWNPSNQLPSNLLIPQLLQSAVRHSLWNLSSQLPMSHRRLLETVWMCKHPKLPHLTMLNWHLLNR